jgi:hypothetical protein
MVLYIGAELRHDPSERPGGAKSAAQKVQRKVARRRIGFSGLRPCVVKTSRRIRMTKLDVREKAERIAELFRGRRPIEILPTDLYPANIDEAYAIRRVFQEIEERKGRGSSPVTRSGLRHRLCKGSVGSTNRATVRSSLARFIMAKPS